MSSHREAPSISKDPVADNTDTYAFVSPDKPDFVTMIMNYIPGEAPAGGPNFYEFGEDVLYEFVIDNDAERRRGRRLPVPVQDQGQEPQHVPVQHRPGHQPDQRQPEPRPDLLGRPRLGRQDPGPRHRPPLSLRPTSVHGRRRTTRPCRPRPSTRCPTAARSSPARAGTASSLTSARSSTWAPCARSRAST